MKSVKSLAVAILVTAITASMPMTASASAAPKLKMSVITKNLIISKQDIKEISLVDNSSTPGVNITLAKEAADKLSEITGSNLQKQLQIAVGDQIISAPVIRGTLGAQFMISTKSQTMAKKIYNALRV